MQLYVSAIFRIEYGFLQLWVILSTIVLIGRKLCLFGAGLVLVIDCKFSVSCSQSAGRKDPACRPSYLHSLMTGLFREVPTFMLSVLSTSIKPFDNRPLGL